MAFDGGGFQRTYFIPHVPHGIDPVLKKKWLRALRSGRYAQTNGDLYMKAGRYEAYCALGLLALVAGVPKEKLLTGSNLDHIGLTHLLGPFDITRDDSLQMTLTSKNDEGASFKELADYIEDNL